MTPTEHIKASEDILHRANIYIAQNPHGDLKVLGALTNEAQVQALLAIATSLELSRRGIKSTYP